MADTLDWRTRKREETHRRIYEVGLRLFQKHGFEQVSVGQIAAEAGVSVPTFYAHFAGKENIVLQLAPAEAVAATMAQTPSDLPVGDRVQAAILTFLRQWEGSAHHDDLLARWRIIAATPSLRVRAAEFERATAGQVMQALPRNGAAPRSDTVVVSAYLSALTAGVLAWADSDGERPLEELINEAFQALRST